jgi:hypothetical protein
VNIAIQSKSKVYPNPGNGVVNFENIDVIKTIKIVNLIGKEVFRKENIKVSKLSVDLSALKPGSYIIQLEDENDRWTTEKLIIE